MFNEKKGAIPAEQKSEIVRLARAVFDYEEWFVWGSGSGWVRIQPTGYQRPSIGWPSIQECIDDLRFRKLTRFTSLAGE
jgi:hypothetical protein